MLTKFDLALTFPDSWETKVNDVFSIHNPDIFSSISLQIKNADVINKMPLKIKQKSKREERCLITCAQ